MAVVNRTDPAKARPRLAEWLSSRIPGGADLRVSEVTTPVGSGLSNETLLFDASWTQDGSPVTRPMVARVAPAGEALFPAYDLSAEARIMRGLGEHTAVPVPRIIGYEGDPAILGSSFLVMERVGGRTLSDNPPFTVEGWLCDLSTEEQATLYDNALAEMAAIHQADWRALGLESLDKPQWGRPGVEQAVGYLDHLARWVLHGREHATIGAGLDWLEANAPDDELVVLNWGDARPGNLLFTESLSVSAVLDWEMASLASPEHDLGHWLFLQRHHTDGIGAPLPAGFLDHAATLDRYTELTGYEPRHFDFYETLAGVNGAVIMVRFADLMISAGLLPADSDMRTVNPATRLLAEMRGFPVPEGDVESLFITGTGAGA